MLTAPGCIYSQGECKCCSKKTGFLPVAFDMSDKSERAAELWHPIRANPSQRAQQSCGTTFWDEEANCHLMEVREICFIQLQLCTILTVFLYPAQGKVGTVSMFDQQVAVCPSALALCCLSLYLLLSD